jgi:delta(3,5)-delta(2,4)-dienoyl-CoA isomerase
VRHKNAIAHIALAADVGSLAYILKIVGNHSLLRELAFSVAPFPAADAQHLGLSSCVVPDGRAEVVQAARYCGSKPLPTRCARFSLLYAPPIHRIPRSSRHLGTLAVAVLGTGEHYHIFHFVRHSGG